MNIKLMRTLVVAFSTVLIPNIASAFYAAHMGRFTSRDPIADRMGTSTREDFSASFARTWNTIERDPASSYRDGTNLYQYVNSSPTIAVDPFGLESFAVCGSHVNPQGPPGETTGQQTKRCCASKCGCNHYDIYSDQSGQIYVGWGGGRPPGIAPPGGPGIPTGPNWDCHKLRRCDTRWTIPGGPGGGSVPYPNHLHWGPKTGQPCAGASDADIAACLRSKPMPKPNGDPGLISNCQTDSQDAAQGCCLCGFSGASLFPSPSY